jgi:hypothetical protein
MNDLLKFISKSLEPFGYHVRPRTGLNFLKIRNLESSENAKNIVTLRKTTRNPVSKLPEGNLNELVIYLRTCMRNQRTASIKPRIGSSDMTEITLRCVLSLLRSVKHAQDAYREINISLFVLDDYSDAPELQKLETLIKQFSIPYTIKTARQTGQGNSLHEQFSISRNEDAIVYFCEDDYLHDENGIAAMIGFYKSMTALTGSHIVIYPQEHHSLYSHHYPSYIVQGEDRHWRSIRHATHTFLTHSKVVQKYWKYFKNTKFVGNKKKRKLGSEARTTNNLFRYVPGFSPLKPCAVHFQSEGLMPPFYDWRPLWEKSILENESPKVWNN